MNIFTDTAEGKALQSARTETEKERAERDFAKMLMRLIPLECGNTQVSLAEKAEQGLEVF